MGTSGSSDVKVLLSVGFHYYQTTWHLAEAFTAKNLMTVLGCRTVERERKLLDKDINVDSLVLLPRLSIER